MRATTGLLVHSRLPTGHGPAPFPARWALATLPKLALQRAAYKGLELALNTEPPCHLGFSAGSWS